MRDKRSIDVSNGIPVDTIEEWMDFDLVHCETQILGRDEPVVKSEH